MSHLALGTYPLPETLFIILLEKQGFHISIIKHYLINK